jgi:GMP synthase (glutamine-hydrolysing)
LSDIAKKETADFIIQGTIYSDRIESGTTKHSSTIKSHHNVGGLPKNLRLKLYEPLRELYKDEVRAIAKALSMPKDITTRQVFPGPGLAVRIIGEVTKKRAQIVREASRIVEEELRDTKYWPQIWMSFAVLLPIKSVGIQGDERSYKYPIVVRIIESRDAMTANFSKIPHDILEKISTRITNEVKGVNRVVYDITNKPPGTMEWE